MDSIFDIALVFSSHEWVQALHRHCSITGDLRIRSLVYDAVAMQGEEFDACVISDSHPALSASLVNSLHESNRIVIGVCDDEVQARKFLSSINVDGIFSSRLSAEELCNEIKTLLTKLESSKSNDHNFDDFNAQSLIEDELPSTLQLAENSRQISVVGTGGSGSSEFSLVLSSRLIDSALVDADFDHPSIAPRIGLDIEPNILSAIESAQNDETTFTQQLQRSDATSVLVGVSHPSFARDIRNYEILSLSKNLATNFTNIVFDLGRISQDSTFFEHQRLILEKSKSIFVVGEPTPVGTLRILETVALICSQFDSKGEVPEIRVVINKCPKNREIFAQIKDELQEIDQITDVYSLDFAKNLNFDTWHSRIKEPKSWKRTIKAILVALEKDKATAIPSNSKQVSDNQEIDLSAIEVA